MKIYSTGQAAKLLGVTRDSLLAALRSGAPEPKYERVGSRRIFTEGDVNALSVWYESRRQAREGHFHA